jgi:hypothetical protein
MFILDHYYFNNDAKLHGLFFPDLTTKRDYFRFLYKLFFLAAYLERESFGKKSPLAARRLNTSLPCKCNKNLIQRCSKSGNVYFIREPSRSIYQITTIYGD